LVLDPSSESEVAISDSNILVWTRGSLTQFWTFLLGLRDQGTLGAIGLSFQPTYKLPIPMPRICGIARPEESDSPVGSLDAPSLKLVDHFKIYHDAGVSMYLRTMLDRWEVRDPTAGKTRVLADSRLVLVDAVSMGVLIS
jgi:hypothetical protein